MMIFTYKGRQARVVFHAGSDHHQLEILVFEREPCKQIFSAKERDIPSKIELTSPPGHADDVQFFSLDPDNFNRKDWHNKDFRWLLDLEGPETFCNKDFERTEDKGFNKKLYVESGRFFTYHRTNSTFRAEVGSLMNTEFSVARFMACDVALAGSEIFTLKVGGTEVEMQNPSKYEIYFLNTCDSCTDSDFPMVFDGIKNGELYKFDLQLVNKGPNTPTPELCYRQLVSRGSDEAPCMGASLGAGNGFP
ncbi:MAG TPA: hypothetical protein VFR78_13670 [Pyrinomonadaceae bacterium]|nr:hypothetical protein [Pyrinomonadaceae bacterium]